MATRVCTKCKENQPLNDSHFPNASRKGKPHRFGTQCRKCQRERSNKHYRDNKQVYKERAKEWDRNNPERVRSNRIKWEKENENSIREAKKSYHSRPEVKEARNEQSRKYRMSEEGRFKESVRAKVNGALKTGNLAKPDECEYCGKSGYVEGHHEDYDKPLKVNWLCKKCHWIKHRLNDGRVS